MEELKKINKKTVICLLLSAILLRIVFLWIGTANHLLAQISSAPNFQITVNTENNAATISGKANFYAISTTPDGNLLTGLHFFFTNTTTGGYSFEAVSADRIKWSINEDTSNWPNGNYDFYAKGDYSGHNYESNHLSISVNNSTSSSSTPLVISFADFPSTVLSGNQTIYAMVNQTADSVKFEVIPSSGSHTVYTSYVVSGEQYKYYFVLDTASFSNGTYTVRAIADKSGLTSAMAEISATVNNSVAATPTFTVTAGIEEVSSGQTINGTKSFWANSVSSNSTSVLNSLDFILKMTSDGSYVHIATAMSDYSYKNWSGSWNSANIADGNYDFFAEGKYKKTDGTYASYKSNFININISNSAAALSVNFCENYSDSAISGLKTICAETNKTADFVEFKITSNSGIAASYKGAKDASLNKYYFVWDTTSFANNIYKLEVTAYKGTETAYALNKATVYNESKTTTSISVEFVNVPAMPLAGDKKIQIKTNLEPTSVKFEVRGAKYIVFSATKIDANNYYFLWKTAEFPNGDYLVYALIEKETDKIEGYIKTSVNNPATTTTEPQIAPLVITFVEKFIPPLSGDQTISISANREIYNCKFKIEGFKLAEMEGIKDSPTQCHILLRTSDFPNGDYIIRAIAGNNSELGENKLSAKIENQISPTKPTSEEPAPANTIFVPQECKDKRFLTPEECQKYMQLPYECRQQNILDETKCKEYVLKLYMPQICVEKNAFAPAECEKVLLLNSLPPECQNQGVATREECDKIINVQNYLTIECKNANIAAPEACNSYMMKNFLPEDCQKAGISSKEECDYLLRNKYGNFESIPGKIEMPSINVEGANGLPPECQKENIISAEDCKKRIILINMPEECQKKNAKTQEDCEKIMFKKFGPKECVEAQIFQKEDCEKFMFKKYAPDDCRQAGILTPEGCKKYMFEKYGEENIPQDKFPIECRKANAKTAKECEKVMKKAYLPKECKDQGVEEEEKCDIYFKQKYMPKECREGRVSSQKECDQVMFKKYAPEECLEAGIEEEDACQKFMFNKYAPMVKCEGLEEWQCKNLVKERHIGNIAATQNKFKKIKEETKELINRTIEAEELESKISQEKEMIPIAGKDTAFRIIAADEKLMLNENNDLIQTPPIAIMIDSDRDNLSDDVEKRIGTDPFDSDTDGDGYGDGEEIKNGYNPLGEGDLKKEMAPVDQALLENKVFGHPKSEGEKTENLVVGSIENALDEQNNQNAGYLLGGKSEPNSVVTIYVYSSLPLIVTVQTDEYGNWKYELSQSLKEGEHEVYAVINDNTGKVVSKSKPLNFFVKEAKAISVKDFVTLEAKASSQTEKESEISLRNYLIAALLITTAGILIFALIIIRKRKAEKL